MEHGTLQKFRELKILEKDPKKWHLTYLSEKNCFKVSSYNGKIAQSIGYFENGQYFVSIPEAVFLLFRNRATLLSNGTDDIFVLDRLVQAQCAQLSVYLNLKSLGYIMTNTDGLEWNLFPPNENFKRSNPTGALGKLSFAKNKELVLSEHLYKEALGINHYTAVSDGVSSLFFRTKWVSMDPSEQDENDIFIIPKDG